MKRFCDWVATMLLGLLGVFGTAAPVFAATLPATGDNRPILLIVGVMVVALVVLIVVGAMSSKGSKKKKKR